VWRLTFRYYGLELLQGGELVGERGIQSKLAHQRPHVRLLFAVLSCSTTPKNKNKKLLDTFYYLFIYH
jgi:hypothetical protein